jgi:hypothetical protein
LRSNEENEPGNVAKGNEERDMTFPIHRLGIGAVEGLDEGPQFPSKMILAGEKRP